MTDKEILLENIKELKKSIFDLIVHVLIVYVRSLAISMALWLLLCFLVATGPNKVGFITLIVTSLITSTVLSIPLIKILKHGIYTLKVVKKLIILLDIYQSFDNIPDNTRINIDIKLNKIDRKTIILDNEISQFIGEDDDE